MKSVIACVAAALILGGCDETFEPIAESALDFSVFGYLDASADTQWIRVSPIRPIMVTERAPMDALVTLEEVGTGRIIQLRDSVFRFVSHQHPELGSDGIFVHNFWTTERIEPGAVYRLSVTGHGAEPASAVVEVPEAFDGEMLIRAVPSEQIDYLRIAGLEHVPFLTVTTTFRDGCGAATVQSLLRPPVATGDEQRIPLTGLTLPARENCGAPILERRTITVIGSATPWPVGQRHSTSSLLPEEVSNISNGIGFLGAGFTRVVPYETCAFTGGGPHPDHCDVRYDASSAVLRGVVRETLCSAGALDSVIVRLTELDRAPAPDRRVRTAITDLSGAFEIAGLVPGVRYDVWVRAKMIIDPFWGAIDTHTRHTDTLTFVPGEVTEYDIGLHELNPCGAGQ